MGEYLKKYERAHRIPTNSLIDKPMCVILGLTLEELTLGVLCFVGMGLFGDSPFWGLLLSVVFVGAAKFFRTHFPKGIVFHILWMFGIPINKFLPKFFRSRRHRILSP